MRSDVDLTRRGFVTAAGALLGTALAGGALSGAVRTLALADDAGGYRVSDAAPHGISVPYPRLASGHEFGEPQFDTGMNYGVFDSATGLTYRFWASEPFVADPDMDVCYAVGGPAQAMLAGFSADESAASFAAKVHLADMPASSSAATIHVAPSNYYIAPTFLQIELPSAGVHDGYIGEYVYLQIALDEGSTPESAVVRSDAWMELRGAGASQDTVVGSIDPAVAQNGLSPLEIQVIARAQQIYDEQIATYGTVSGYVAHVLDTREYYLKSLRQAKLYGQAYDDICNFSEAFASVALGVVAQQPGAIASPLADMLADEAIEHSFLNEVAKDFTGITADEFVYSQATLGGKMVQINGLRDAMEAAEDNGGRFVSAADAARFVLVYQRNRAGFAALAMGKDFYMDQLNRSPLDALGDILAHLVIDAGLGDVIPGGWLEGYVSGKAVEALENALDVIVAEMDNPHVTKWRDELVLIEQETREIFTAPLVYTVSRENGLMGKPEGLGQLPVPTPEQLEALGLYTAFDAPQGLSPQAAAAFLKEVDALVNSYGGEYVAYDSESGSYHKAGMTGGWLADFNGDGVLEMLVVARREGAWRTTDTPMVHYEFWVWENGVANKLFFGELENGEYLNVWEGGSGRYLEMGNGGGAGDHWFMQFDADGVFGRVSTPPSEGDLVRRIPVGEGDRVFLANSKPFVAHLASAAASLAASDATSVLDCVKYVGDPSACRMGANRARAYADSIAADYHADVNGTDSSFLQAMLVDAGDDGYPLLVKTLPHSYFLLDGGSHFITDAMLCQYRYGAVKEYPFIEEIGVVGEPHILSVGLVSAEQRKESVPVLAVDLSGRYMNGERSATAQAFYFSDEGKIKLFHTLLTVDGPDDDEYYWDGERSYAPEEELRSAGLDYDGYPEAFFSMNYADQNAAPGTSADVMEAMLRAYADAVGFDEVIEQEPAAKEPGVIYHGGEQKYSERFGATLAELIRGKSATTYHPHLAYALVSLAAAAYNEKDIRLSLQNLGLFDIDQRNYYDDPDDERYGDDSVGFCVATGKTTDGRTLICVPIRGTYGPIEKLTKDWRSDFHLGEAFAVNTWHTGFDIASGEVFGAISHGTKDVDTKAVYVICGHSRGGAVGNLLAVRLQRAGVPSENVFCYNFACPDTARGSVVDWNYRGVHGNIWNIGRPSDPVSLIPGIVGDLLRAGALGIASGGILSIPSNPLSAWGKFGRSYWYAPDWGDTADLVPDLSFAPHETLGYIRLLAGEPSLDDMREWGEMVALLPVSSYVTEYKTLAELIDQYGTW